MVPWFTQAPPSLTDYIRSLDKKRWKMNCILHFHISQGIFDHATPFPKLRIRMRLVVTDLPNARFEIGPEISDFFNPDKSNADLLDFEIAYLRIDDISPQEIPYK